MMALNLEFSKLKFVASKSWEQGSFHMVSRTNIVFKYFYFLTHEHIAFLK